MSKVVVNRVTLEMLECGRGEVLVLVHGSGSDHRTWQAQVAPWCERYRVVTYSRRYHWPNRPIEPGGVYALESHVSDLEALIVGLGPAPLALVGHSYGGLVSLVLAARRPDLCGALVIAEPPVMGLFLDTPPSLTALLALAARRPRTAISLMRFGAGALEPAAKALARGARDEAIGLLGAGILGREAFRDLAPERLDQVRANVTLEELKSGAALPRLDPEGIASISCPTLLLEGDRSPAVFGRLLDRLEELLPHPRRTVIPGASHLMHEDNPERFNEVVESFLSK